MVDLTESQFEILKSIADDSPIELNESNCNDCYYLERNNLGHIRYDTGVRLISISAGGKACLHSLNIGEHRQSKSEFRECVTMWVAIVTLILTVISFLHTFGVINYIRGLI